MGDVYADYVPEVLGKYYAYDFEGLQFIKVTGPELVNLDDWENTGLSALEYILAQEKIDNSIFYSEDPLKMGIGCGCDSEEDGEHTWTCFIVVADSVRARRTDIFIPYFQSTQGWEVCSDLCPYINKEEQTPDEYYMAGSKWDSLYRTSCEEPEILDRDGLCSTMDELVFGCSVIEETEWVQSARTKKWN